MALPHEKPKDPDLCSKIPNMVIAFANQKGGVGKSTLCLSLANYWASQGLPVHIVDTDLQRSLVNIRKEEMRKYPERQPLFDIEYYKADQFKDVVSQRRADQRNLLIDLPGSCDKHVLEVIRFSDFIIVPFQYEETVLETTSQFGTFLDLLDEKFKEVKRQVIYVPNKFKCNVGQKEEKAFWEVWRDAIEAVAILPPPIPDRICMQRRSSIFLKPEERECVTPCFEFITDIVFKRQLTIEKSKEQK